MIIAEFWVRLPGRRQVLNTAKGTSDLSFHGVEIGLTVTLGAFGDYLPDKRFHRLRLAASPA